MVKQLHELTGRQKAKKQSSRNSRTRTSNSGLSKINKLPENDLNRLKKLSGLPITESIKIKEVLHPDDIKNDQEDIMRTYTSMIDEQRTGMWSDDEGMIAMYDQDLTDGLAAIEAIIDDDDFEPLNNMDTAARDGVWEAFNAHGIDLNDMMIEGINEMHNCSCGDSCPGASCKCGCQDNKAIDENEIKTLSSQMREWSNSIYKQYDDKGHIHEPPKGETVDISLRRYLNAKPHKVSIEEDIVAEKLIEEYHKFKGNS